MANRYWVGGAGTWNTTSTTNWSASSGGASGASVPTAADSVFFDQAGTYNVTLSGTGLVCLDLTVSAGTVSFISGGTLTISGSMSLIAGTSWAASGALTFNATTTGKTITTNGTSLSPSSITFNGSGGGWTLGSALTTTGAGGLVFTQGTFNTGNFACTNVTWSLSGSSTRAISLGSSTITLSSAGVPWSASTTTNLTFTAGTSTINFTASGPTINGGGLTYGTVSFSNTTSTFTGPIINGNNTFLNINITSPTAGNKGIRTAGNQTITGTLTANSGTYNTRTFFYSSVFGTSRTITTAAVALSYVDFRDITAAGAAGTWTGTSLGNCGGNSNITFTATKTVYWNLAGSQNWSATGWAATSGGAPAAANFPLAQDTAVINQSSAITTLTMDDNWNIGTLDMSARTSAITLSISLNNPYIYGSWKNGTGVTLAGGANLTFAGRGTNQLTSAGRTFSQPIYIDCLTGTYQLQDAFTTTSDTYYQSGTLDINGKTFTTNAFNSTNSNTRTLAFGVGNITCSASHWNVGTTTGLTVTGTPVVNMASTGSTLIIVNSGPLPEASAISFNFSSGTYPLNFLGTASYCAKNVNFNSFAGTWTGNAANCSIYGNLTLSASMTLTASANALTFGATSGTQTITSNGKTMDYPVTKSGGGTLTCADALTLGSTRALSFDTGTIKLKASATNTVGSFVTSGSTLKYLQSTTAGTQATISAASGTNTVTYLSIQDSAATGGATWDATDVTNVNAGNNTGWTGLPALASTGNFFFMFN